MKKSFISLWLWDKYPTPHPDLQKMLVEEVYTID